MLGLLALLFLTGMQKSGALRDGEAPVFLLYNAVWCFQRPL